MKDLQIDSRRRQFSDSYMRCIRFEFFRDGGIKERRHVCAERLPAAMIENTPTRLTPSHEKEFFVG